MAPLVALLLTAVAGAAVGVGTYAATGGRTTTTVVRQAVAASSAKPASSSTTSVAQVYKDAAQGVVEVFERTGSSSSFPFGGSQETIGQGSGFVYDTAGHIITNDHVVDGARSVTVRFANGKSYAAKVVGTDPSTDVAVLKIDAPASQLHPLTLGDSSTVQVGDGVIAIGSPFGLVNSVSTGIVSALDRTISSPNNDAIVGAIQTDAAINHGNSGGPLLDTNGDVIGVNSQIDSSSGGNDGVGFAVPVNTVQRIATELISSGKAEHAFLGVSITSGGGGARVTGVRPGSPAAKAGLKAADVIIRAAGRPVGSATDLRVAIDAQKPGAHVTVTYRRSGSSHSVSVTLVSRPSSPS
jgi:putative serine protease PepD